MALDGLTKIILLVIFLVTGLVCGIMFNVALGRKPLESGGLMGGLVVGFLMWAI
jgi:hypothetical protein